MSATDQRKQERAFGRSVGGVLVILGVYQLARGRGIPGASLAAIGALLVLLGTLAPATLRVPSRLWWRFSGALGWVNSRVLLSLFYFVVLTPLGAVFRLTGRDALSQRPADTTWVPYPERRGDHYEHLF